MSVNIPILFEDENIVALLKPAGISVHPDGKNKEFCVTDFLIKKFPKIKNIGEPMKISPEVEIKRPGIAHRIDKETSGVLLAAKTSKGYESLKEQFKKRIIKKTYHTFVYGSMKEERGIIDKPIGRSARDPRKRTVGKGIRGIEREAITKFKTIKKDSTASFLEVWPQTGRTHQIRVHLKSVHHPIVADPLYAGHTQKILGFERLALHASKISFLDLSGKKIEITAPFPEDFKKAMKAMDIKI